MTAQQITTGFKIEVGGETFQSGQSDGLISVVVEDHVDMACVCMVTISTGLNQSKRSFTIGDKVKAFMHAEDDLFHGEVISIDHSFQPKGGSVLILRCIDNSHRLGRGRKTRFWNDMKDSDVAREVGEECQLQVECEDSPETHKYILQRNESNLSFLKRLAARNNFQLRVEPEKLIFKPAELGGTPRKISAESGLLSLNLSFNSAEMVQEVVVRGWDVASKKEIVGVATASDVVPVGSGEIGAVASSVFGDTTAYITDVPVRSQEMADSIAKAEMERIARKFCRGKCTIVGDHTVRAGTIVELEQFGQGLNGSFYAVSTRHILTPSSGYKTEIALCSNSFGA